MQIINVNGNMWKMFQNALSYHHFVDSYGILAVAVIFEWDLEVHLINHVGY